MASFDVTLLFPPGTYVVLRGPPTLVVGSGRIWDVPMPGL